MLVVKKKIFLFFFCYNENKVMHSLKNNGYYMCLNNYFIKV